MKRKKFIGFSVLILVFVLCVACSNTSDKLTDTNQPIEGNKEEKIEVTDDKISLYISGPEKMVDELKETFEKEHGDVIEIFNNGCGPIQQKIWSEMESGEIEADVVWAAEPLMYMKLQEKGKLLEYKSSQVENLKPEYQKIANGYYTPVNSRFGVIIYNKDLLSEENAPKAFEDLTKEVFKGKIAMADARQSSTAYALNCGLYQVFGNKWDYHQSLVDNDIMLIKQNVAAIEKVDSGEVYATIAPHDGALRMIKIAKKKELESPLVISWPKEGAISIQRPIAIIDKPSRSEEKTNLAKEFVDFALSEEAQQISTKYGFIPVIKDLPLPKGIPSEVRSTVVNWEELSKNEEELKEKYNEVYSQN